jgi:outer membrane lipoprotein-sorting protein
LRTGRKILGCCLALLVLGPLGAATSDAHVLEGPHALTLMINALSGADTLRVEQHVVIEDPALSEHPLELTETLSYIFPDRFRSDTRYETTNRIFVASHGQALTVIDGRIVSDQEGQFDRYKDLLLYHSRELLLKALLLNHVDVGVTSLGRFDEHIAIVIGAQYPDESVPQVWVDKEQFVPLRWIHYPGSHNEAGVPDCLEFVYRNWKKWGDVWYPSLIESYHNRRLMRRMRVASVQANASFSEQLLSITHLISIYSQPEPSQPVASPGGDVGEIQKTIDDFKKKFEP